MAERGRQEGEGRSFDIRNVRRDVRADLADELAFHFEQTIEELIRAGWSPVEARAEAQRRFGDQQRYVTELVRTDRRTARGEALRRRLQDGWSAWKIVLRGLGRSPGFAVTAVLTLALGIGANATMFGIVDRLLLRPPDHVVNAERVRRLFVRREWRPGDLIVDNTLSYPDVEDWEGARTIRSLAAYSSWGEVTMGRGPGSIRVRAALAQAAFFPTLGVQPALGRFYTRDEDRVGGPTVAVLGYELWQSAFGGDPGVVGRTIELGGEAFDIVGVAPQRFTGMELRRVDLWLPLEKYGFEVMGNASDSRNDWWVNAVARLADTVSVARVEAELTALHRAGRADAGGSYDPEASIVAVSSIVARGPEGESGGPGSVARVSVWLAGVSLVVLLIACANVANLFLARASQRRRELAVRVSLGIPRERLAFMVLGESLLLAVFAAFAAMALATWGGAVVRRTLLPDVDWSGVGWDPRVGLATLGVTLLAGVLAGVAPAMSATRTDVIEGLRAGDGRSSLGRSRVRTALLVLQPGLSVLLLVGAGLFVRSLSAVRGIDLGFDPDGLYTVRLEADEGGNPLPSATSPLADLYERAQERAGALPVVDQAALAFSMPFRDSWSAEFRAPGLDSLPHFPGGGPYLNAVSPQFLSTMGLEVRRGRGIEDSDAEGTLPVMVVNEYLASRLWPDQDPIGRCVLIGRDAETCTTVVGVVENAHRQGLIEPDEALYYLPLAQHLNDYPPRTLFVRVRPGAADVQQSLRRELEGFDSRIRFAAVRGYREILDPQARAWQLGATLFTLFGALALVVAAVGIYSVFAFDVTRRVPEIGIRGALGATPGWIVRLVLADVARVAGTGLVLGLVVALLLAPRLAPLLYAVPARDPVVLASVTVVLCLVALAAGAVPAWRATRVEPTVALRAE